MGPGRMGLGQRVRSAAALALPGTRERRVQVGAYAEAWAAHNRVAIGQRGDGVRRWVALGDSTSQGIGASTPWRGWVGRTLDHLATDADWQVVNLSVTGARIADVLDRQLPLLDDLAPVDLVTVAVGANDLLRTRTPAVVAAVDRLLAEVPDDTVVATLPQGVRSRVAAGLNERIRAGAAARSLPVADVWARTGPPWAGKYAADAFHPNDRGYEDWTAAFVEVLGPWRAGSPGGRQGWS